MDGGWESLDAEAYRALFFHSLDGVLFTDPVSGKILAANPAACIMLGYPEDDICRLGRDGIMDPVDVSRWRERVAERARTGSFRGELSFQRGDGSTFPAEVTAQMFADRNGATRSCLFVRDITEQRCLEQELWELALVDDLTGLHNRRAFILLADHAIKEAARAQRPIIGLVADVDSLKAINDTYGHAEGDRALRIVAGALEGSCRETDIVGRLSGDEFAILLAETHDFDRLERRVRNRLAHAARGLAYALCISIGVASCPPGHPHDCQLDDLLRRADQAMYADKTANRRPPHP